MAGRSQIPLVSQVAAAPLSNGALQLWAVTSAGELFSTWKEAPDAHANWAPWQTFPAPATPPVQVAQVAAARLSNGALELWAVSNQGELFSTWKETPDANADWVPWQSFPALPEPVSQVTAAPLSNGALQLWAVTNQGQLFSTWKETSEANANWVPWQTFLGPAAPPAKVNQLAAAPLSNGALQLWVVTNQGQLFSTWKETPDANANWLPWQTFPGSPPGAAQVVQVAAAPLSNGALQLWAVTEQGQLLSTWKESPEPHANWAWWVDFAGAAPSASRVSQVAVAPLSNAALQLWAVTDQGRLLSTWKRSNDANAGWVPWESFLA